MPFQDPVQQREYKRRWYLANKERLAEHKKKYHADYYRQNIEAQKAYLNNRNRERQLRRSLILGIVKTTAGCADCGYDLHAEALDFDHVSGEKLDNISHMSRRAWNLVWEEIMKCDVVCANCHRIRTKERRENVHSGSA